MRWPLIGVAAALGIWVVMQACSRKKIDEMAMQAAATARPGGAAERGSGSPLAAGNARSANSEAAIGDRAAQSELPTYVVLPLGSGDSITIDGRLDEPAWRATSPTRKFVHPGTGAPLGPNAAIGGTVRLRYDQHALYFAFEALDRDVRGGFDPKATDPHLWTRDTVEIMLDPDGDGDNRDYYEIQLNPQGLVFDSQFDDYNQPRVLPDGPFGHQDFDSEIQRAVTVEGSLDNQNDSDRGYIVEAALPWKSLTKARRVPPKAGDEWRANFYVMQDNGGVSWSAILGQGNFHKASRFGRLRFGGH